MAKGNQYLPLSRKWKKGDVITFHLPMKVSVEQIPDKKDYYAFLYGPNFPATTAQNTQKGSSYSQTRATAAFFMCHIISLSTSSKWRTLLIRFDFPVSNRSRGTVEVDADLHHFPVVCLIRNRIPFAVNLR